MSLSLLNPFLLLVCRVHILGVIDLLRNWLFSIVCFFSLGCFSVWFCIFLVVLPCLSKGFVAFGWRVFSFRNSALDINQ